MEIPVELIIILILSIGLVIITIASVRDRNDNSEFVEDIYETVTFGFEEGVKATIDARIKNGWKVTDIWVANNCTVVNFVLENVVYESDDVHKNDNPKTI